MSKKCVKCGHPLPEDASFCPHCTAIQVEKEEIRAPRRWKKKVFVIGAVLVFLAGVGFAFSLYHKPKVYEANARIVYPDQDHSYRLLVTYSEADALAGQAQGDRTDMLADGLELPFLLQNLILQGGVLLLKRGEHLLPLGPVAGEIPPQGLQLGKALSGGLLLRLQAGPAHVQLRDGLPDTGGARLELALALGLALGLGPQGGGRALQGLNARPGGGGIRLGLGGAGLNLLQLPALLVPAAGGIGELGVEMGQPLLQLEDGVLVLALLGLGGLHLVCGGGGLPPGLLHGLGGGGALLRSICRSFFSSCAAPSPEAGVNAFPPPGTR